MIYIENRRNKPENLHKKYPKAVIIDVTSKGKEPFIKLSPFYPHGDIPVPESPNIYSQSVEGIWQGLKVFEKKDIDFSKFSITGMKGIKRTARTFGKPLGHRKGIYGKELLDYILARKEIYLPSYIWILENKVRDLIKKLAEFANSFDLVLLDFETNCDIEDTNKPLSHAGIIKHYIETKFPVLDTSVVTKISNKEKIVKKKNFKSKTRRIKRIDQILLF